RHSRRSRVIPAKAGIKGVRSCNSTGIPAFAGMTTLIQTTLIQQPFTSPRSTCWARTLPMLAFCRVVEQAGRPRLLRARFRRRNIEVARRPSRKLIHDLNEALARLLDVRVDAVDLMKTGFSGNAVAGVV